MSITITAESFRWKIITIIFTFMFILINVSTIDFTNQLAGASPPPPNDAVDGLQFIEGDWHVYGTEGYGDEIIDLSGNLIIHSGGVLKFSNVELRMNVTSTSPKYHIEVQGGGYFYIMDNDNDPSTVTDASNITDSIFDYDNLLTNSSDYRYYIDVQSGGLLNIRNSFVREIGLLDGADNKERSLYVDKANLEIQDTIISNCYYGIYINSNFDVTARNALIENTTFLNSQYALNMESAKHVDIKYSHFINIQYDSIYITNSQTIDIFNCTFYNISTVGSEATVYSAYSSSINIVGCDFEYSNYGYLSHYTSNIFVMQTKFKNVQNYAIYNRANGAENFYFLSNVFENIGGESIHIEQATTTYIFGNQFYNLSDNAVDSSGGKELYIEFNFIQNISKSPITISYGSDYFIRNNTLNCTNLWDYAMYFNRASVITIENNFIVNAFDGIKIFRSSVQNIIKNNQIYGRDSLGPTEGFDLSNTDDVLMMNNSIINFKVGIYGYHVTFNYLNKPMRVYYGSIEMCQTSLSVDGNSAIDMYNVSFNTSSMSIGASPKTTVNVYYSVDISVTDTKGPVGAAFVTAVNETMEIERESYTNEFGWVKNLFLLNGTYTTSSTDFASPYNITVNTSGDYAFGSQNYTIDSYKVIYISYNINTKPGPPIGLRIEVNYSSVELIWECYVTDLMSYKVYRNKTSGGWEEVAHITSPPAGVDQKWSDVDNATKFVAYTYKVHHIDTAAEEGTNEFTVIFNDWVIIDQKTFSDWKVSHNGSVIIETGGELQLQNVSLKMNGTYGSVEIERFEVRSGGTLILTDGDNDNKTEGDRTFINASSKMGTYSIIVNSGGAMEMHNSHIQNASFRIADSGVEAPTSTSECAIFVNDGRLEVYNSTIIATNIGIYLNNVNESTIYGTHFENNGVKNYLFGIGVIGSTNVLIENNSFNNSAYYEIFLYITGFIDIVNNSMSCQGDGIYISGSNNIYIYQNYIENPSNYGIYIYASEDSTIDNNRITNFKSAGINVYQSYNINVYQNTLYDAPFTANGIYMYQSNDCEFYDNTITNLNPSASGIYCYDFESLILSYNKISKVYRGIFIGNLGKYVIVEKVFLYNNTINETYSDGYGIDLFNCVNFLILNNTIYDSFSGISMSSSNTNYVADNRIYNVTYGTYQEGGFGAYYDSNVLSNVNWGFYFREGADGTVNNCTILGSPTYPVYVNLSSEVRLVNPYFNITKIRISDKTCRIHIEWLFDLLVRDQFGSPQPNIFVRVRNIFGTILYEQFTDINGMVYNIIVNSRTQFYASNQTNTPHTFEASLGAHSGTDQIEIKSSATIQMQLGNSAPSAYNVIINPLIPRTKDTLTLGYFFSDPEADIDQGTVIKWYRNNVYQSSLDNLTAIPDQYTSKGDFWFCKVTPSDGADYGITTTSTTAWIYNTKPTVNNAHLEPTNPDSTDDLIVNYTYSDDDSDIELGTIYRWFLYVNVTFELRETTTEPILNHTKTKKGDEWKVDIEPKDGESSGDIVTSDPIFVGNTKPFVENARIIPDKPTSKDDITVMYDFKDEDSDPEEDTEYKWYKVPVGELNFIEAGFADRTVPTDALTKGERWKCEITPRDGSAQTGLKVNSSEVIIENSAPDITALQTFPEAPMTEDELWVEYNYFDRDGDSENDTSYEWMKWSGIAYLRTGLKVQKLPSIFTAKGDRWICEVIPNDGYTFGASVFSPEVVIGNSPPVVTELSIIPEGARTVDTLEANYLYFDADGDLETDSQIKWFRNDVHQTGLDDQKTIGRSNTQKGENWHFVITPNDGINFGSEMESPKIEILNSPPEIRSPKITNLFPRGDEDLDISYVFYDSDGDTENQTEIRWYMNGMLMPEFNDLKTIPANETEKDQSWHYLIRASDDTNISEFNESFPVTIRNSRPVILDYHPLESDITLTETESYEFGVGVFDMDGDVLFFEWALENQQTFQTTIVGNDEVLDLQTDYNSSGIYILTVTVQDYGKDSYKITQKWNVTILNNNRPPKITVNEPDSEEPKVTVEKSLRFSIDYSDEDSEDVLHVYWYLNGQKQDTDVSSYTYLPKKYEEGKNTIHVDVDDGFNTTTETWNVTVKGKGDDLIYGRSWDQWSVIIQVIVIVASAIIGIIGFYKLRKKKGTMYDYKKQIDEPMKNWQTDPVKSEDQLMDAAEQIERNFNDGLVEDLQYIILNRQIKENLREIRQGQVDQSFSYLPADSMKELEKMLEDGRISEEEYQTFLGVLSHSKELTGEEKERVKMQLQTWRVKDIQRGINVKK